MNERIKQAIDHTQLQQTATWAQIKVLCDEAMTNQVASVCIAPCFVKRAKAYMADQMAICTVIGFPNGYQSTEVKLYETKMALADGADEIDMVINLGDLKAGDDEAVSSEIKAIKALCNEKILKVIIETCYLSEAEKIKMCAIITCSGADYIKTSTGFGSGGATEADIALFKAHLGPDVKIKAAGGIKSLAMAEIFLQMGVSRLGSSSLLEKCLSEA